MGRNYCFLALKSENYLLLPRFPAQCHPQSKASIMVLDSPKVLSAKNMFMWRPRGAEQIYVDIEKRNFEKEAELGSAVDVNMKTRLNQSNLF